MKSKKRDCGQATRLKYIVQGMMLEKNAAKRAIFEFPKSSFVSKKITKIVSTPAITAGSLIANVLSPKRLMVGTVR